MGAPLFPISKTGDGTTKVFDLGFPFLDEADVRVTVAGVLKVRGTDYALQVPSTDSAGWTVRFFTAPANAAAIKFYRNTSLALRKPPLEIGHLVALQALYRQQEQGEALISVPVPINATDLAAGTAQTIIAPCDGYISKAGGLVVEAIGTGGDITVEVEGVAVVGLTLTFANSAPIGKYLEDSPTTAQSATTKVRRGQAITVTPGAAFASTGAVNVDVYFQPADLD